MFCRIMILWPFQDVRVVRTDLRSTARPPPRSQTLTASFFSFSTRALFQSNETLFVGLGRPERVVAFKIYPLVCACACMTWRLVHTACISTACVQRRHPELPALPPLAPQRETNRQTYKTPKEKKDRQTKAPETRIGAGGVVGCSVSGEGHRVGNEFERN